MWIRMGRRSLGRGYGDAGRIVWCWLRDDCGVSWVALSVECACVDEMTNMVSVISHGPILLVGCECGHLKRWVMLAGQSRPSRASIKARKAVPQRPSSTLALTESW